MKHPTLTLDWDESPTKLPLFQRIAESIVRDIRRGRLRPGARLPSSRSLADTLGVHRNTILAAYQELERQGYLETIPGSGAFVPASLPETPPRNFRGPKSGAPVRFELPEFRPRDPWAPLGPHEIALIGGMPDLRHFPERAWNRAYRAAVRFGRAGFDYQSPQGEPRLLAVLGSFLSDTRGIVSSSEELLVARGSQLALYLAARAILPQGGYIAVEALGYRPAWEAFRLAGAKLVPVPVDGDGLSLRHLEKLARTKKLAGVYVTPHHQYPTTVTLSAARRLELLNLAERERFVVIEDDYDHEFHFEGRPILPLKSADPRQVVIHIGTLSKVLAPGIRVGYAVAQAPIIERMAYHRTFLDRQGDHVLERALSYFIEDGELGAHIRKMHRFYAERRETLFSGLEKRLGGVLEFSRPKGGIALWARVSSDVAIERWVERAAAEGLRLHPGTRYAFSERPLSWLRLGFALHTPAEIRQGIDRLLAALP